MDNLGCQFLITKGVLAQLQGFDAAGGPQAVSTVYAVRLGDAQIITAPGELFPELFYGVAKYRRQDCPKADTGRPPAAAAFKTLASCWSAFSVSATFWNAVRTVLRLFGGLGIGASRGAFSMQEGTAFKDGLRDARAYIPKASLR